MAIITRLVVRLSSTAERKNVRNTTAHNSLRLLLVRSHDLTKLNPPLESTTSTTVIAPSRKKIVSDVLPR